MFNPGITFHQNIFIIARLPKRLKMVQRIGGLRRKSRYKFTKELRAKGKISLTNYFRSFNSGDRIHLAVESGVQKGMYHPRFMGKSGIISGRRGRCYEVKINDFGKEKILIVHPVHLRKA